MDDSLSFHKNGAVLCNAGEMPLNADFFGFFSGGEEGGYEAG